MFVLKITPCSRALLEVAPYTFYSRWRQLRGQGFRPRLFVCLSIFPHDISITDAASITKLDTEMFQKDS